MGSIRRVELATWALVYGGMGLAAIGFALQRERAEFGWAFVVIGACAVLAGIVLIWLRSRMRSPAEVPSPQPSETKP